MDRHPQKTRHLIVVKGYPRVSETFIAQEILGLEQAGLEVEIVSLRAPYDAFTHAIHDRIRAPVLYLPERLRDDPRRVLGALGAALRHGWLRRGLPAVLKDLARDPSRDRIRRFGQALVLAAERPGDRHVLYAHFAHTPASVARYAATMLRRPFSISAHARDIWTTPDWDLRAKLTEARWTVTCTRVGHDRLKALAPDAAVHLCYHGLDLSRFAPPGGDRPPRDGRDPDDPVRILSVGRAVEKKGYDTVLAALAALPPDLHWRFDHIGRGPELERLQREAQRLGLTARIAWRGPQPQDVVLEAYRRADLFVLASRAAADDDRDGLPNVLVEASSQRLPCIATAFSAIPELVEDGVTGLLVPVTAPDALAAALARAVSDPDLRRRLGEAAETRVRGAFDFRPGVRRIAALLDGTAPPAQRP